MLITRFQLQIIIIITYSTLHDTAWGEPGLRLYFKPLRRHKIYVARYSYPEIDSQ